MYINRCRMGITPPMIPPRGDVQKSGVNLGITPPMIPPGGDV
jgi:hypothetical protein